MTHDSPAAPSQHSGCALAVASDSDPDPDEALRRALGQPLPPRQFMPDKVCSVCRRTFEDCRCTGAVPGPAEAALRIRLIHSGVRF